MPGATTVDDEPLRAEYVWQRFALDLPEPKFRAPKLRDEFVRRAELLSRLEKERARPLTLVTAPAGYGKTTLLTQWIMEVGSPTAWVTLDERDGAAEILADSIAHALTGIGVEPGLMRSFALVLDDAHLVARGVLEEAILGILAWLPEGSQLAVASRCELALSLGRMRAERVLSEVQSDDLSMSAAEAASLLRNTGRELEFAEVQELVRRTEGWPAMLELAASSYGQQSELAEQPVQPRGDDHVISEYFRAELLASLSPATARFLIRGSVLDRMSGPLCDAVLGRKRSATLLAELARMNVPLRPVDASHEWYRLHGLFREMLQTELRRADPEAEPALHGRASDWHIGAGDRDARHRPRPPGGRSRSHRGAAVGRPAPVSGRRTQRRRPTVAGRRHGRAGRRVSAARAGGGVQQPGAGQRRRR